MNLIEAGAIDTFFLMIFALCVLKIDQISEDPSNGDLKIGCHTPEIFVT